METSNHAAFSLTYHVILTSKYRHHCINAAMLARLTDPCLSGMGAAYKVFLRLPTGAYILTAATGLGLTAMPRRLRCPVFPT